MEICVGRHVLAPNVWAREAEIYDATVRLEVSATVAALTAALARIDAALPQRRDIFGVFTPTDPSAGEAFRTDLPRLLGQWLTLLAVIVAWVPFRAGGTVAWRLM